MSSQVIHPGLERKRQESMDKSTAEGLAAAVRAHLKGDAAAALEALRPCTTGDKIHPDVLSARAHLSMELKRYDEAAADYERLLAGNSGQPEAQYQLSVCQFYQGKFEEALAHANQSSELDASRADAPLVAGICLLNLKRAEESLDAFGRCLEKAPGMEAAMLGTGVALQLTWEFDEALAIYRQLLERSPKSEDVLVNLVALGMQRKDYALVRKYAEILLALNSSSTAALEGLGSAAFAASEFPEAAVHYAKLVELQPQNYDYWFNLGVANHRSGEYLEAATAYLNAATARPDLAAAHINIAAVYTELGDLQASREALERALRIVPGREDLQFQLGVVLERQGHSEDAVSLYSTLTAANPENEDAWFRLGYLQIEAGRFSEAAESFASCLKKRPDWNDAAINLALCYWRLGENAKSREVLEALLGREPKSVDGVRGLAAVALNEDDPNEALTWHLRLQQLGDHSPEVLHNTGLLLHRTGDVNASIQNYREALKVKPDFAEALLNLGHVLQAAGQDQEARETWAKALELKPELAAGYFLPAA
jgi:tetratricopeptide (TPR) repeat protein